jgi:hypothetical protein
MGEKIKNLFVILMKIPINCPICSNSLINTFDEENNKVLYKNCRLQPDHIFGAIVFLESGREGEDILHTIAVTLSINPPLSVEIYLEGPSRWNVMWIDRSVPDATVSLTHYKRLPFCVIPDFFDRVSYVKWCQKVKTYILFS